jgi:hypothetical protein
MLRERYFGHRCLRKRASARAWWANRANALRVACLASCLTFSGCYAGAAGIVLGLLSLTKDEGADPQNKVPATPLLDPTVRANGEQVIVSYNLFDDDGGPLDVAVEWQPVDGSGKGLLPFSTASEYTGPVAAPGGRTVKSDGRFGLEVAPNVPRAFLFVWSARSDLLRSPLGLPAAQVRMRITSHEEAGDGEPGFSDSFTAGNDPPEVLSVVPLGSSGTIPFAITIADSSADPVTLTATFSFAGETSPRPMTLVGTAAGTVFETLPGAGKLNFIFWDSGNVHDLGTQARSDVTIEVVPRDLETGIGRTRASFAVDNNGDPVVQVLNVAGSPDRSFEVPIRFVVRDDEEDAVGVILQWAEAGKEFPALPLDDPERLSRLLDAEDPGMDPLRNELHVLTEAPVFRRGSVEEGPGLAENQIRATDLVRQGLVFRPPGEDGPRPLPAGPLDERSGVFLIGQEMSFFKANGFPPLTAKIEGFEPSTSTLPATTSWTCSSRTPRATSEAMPVGGSGRPPAASA